MTPDFIKQFLATSEKVNRLGKTMSWPIPAGADKNKGDFGLLPDDQTIGAWQIPPTTAQLLRFLVLSKKAKTILELGTSIGYSTMWLAFGAKETGGHVYGTEIFEPKAVLALEHLREAGVADQCTLIQKDIIEVLDTWNEGKIDFVFMDADKQRYDQYLDRLLPLLSDNGLIVVDNAGNYAKHMKPFLDKCKSDKGLIYHFLNIDFGLQLILKNNGTNLYVR